MTTDSHFGATRTTGSIRATTPLRFSTVSGSKDAGRHDPSRTSAVRYASRPTDKYSGRARGVVAFGTRGYGDGANARWDGRRSSFGLSIGAFGDHRSGYLSLDRHGDRTHVDLGVFFHHGDDRHVCRPGCYGHSGYRRSFFGSSYYYPFYGRRYCSTYSYYPYHGVYPYGTLYTSYFPSVYAPVYYEPVVYGVEVPTYTDTVTEYTPAQQGPDYLGYGVSSPPTATVAAPTTPAAEMDPELVARLDQGDAAFAAGRFEDARRAYAAAMMANESDGVVTLLYAVSSFALGEYDVAGAALRRALEVTPELGEQPIDVRRLYPQGYLFETHRDDLAIFVGDRTDNPDAKLLLGYIYFASGDAQRAKTIFEQVRAAHPDDELAGRLAVAAFEVLQREPATP